MLPANKIGATRMALAEILTEFCGSYVAPAQLEQNYPDYRGGRNYGYAFSWYVDVPFAHPLYGCGSGVTMRDFVREYKKGLVIAVWKEEIFLNRREP